MTIDSTTVQAIAASIHIRGEEEAEALLRATLPHYRGGTITWQALTAACRFLYAGYATYSPLAKATMLREARGILRLGERAVSLA